MSDQELLSNTEKTENTPRQDALVEQYPDGLFLTADGLDDAIVGVDEPSDRVIYSVRRILRLLIDQGLTLEEAQEHFSFNIEGAYMGDKTPIWCHDEFLRGIQDGE